jgi:predicted membrane channel-forming protein YqfA (hemolysin III family)
MQTQANPIHAKLRLSGAFIILGLMVQALSLLWNHPLSFIAFVTIGGLLLAIGIVLYLLTLVNMQTAIPEEKTGTASQTPQN